VLVDVRLEDGLELDDVDDRNAVEVELLELGERLQLERELLQPEDVAPSPDHHRRGCRHGSCAGGRSSAVAPGAAWVAVAGGQSRRGGVKAYAVAPTAVAPISTRAI
jgi:hypothetical protein